MAKKMPASGFRVSGFMSGCGLLQDLIFTSGCSLIQDLVFTSGCSLVQGLVFTSGQGVVLPKTQLIIYALLTPKGLKH